MSVAVHVSASEGTCEFLRSAHDGSKGSDPDDGLHLRIVVSHLQPKECAAGDRLIGVGEDSVRCSIVVDGRQQEMIRARVRSIYLLVTLIAGKGIPTNTAQLRSIVERVAEEVAGNLF